MATQFSDVPVFVGLSVTGTHAGFLGMSTIGQLGNGWEGWSISNLSASTGKTTVNASTSPELATLVAQLIRRGVISGSGTGF